MGVIWFTELSTHIYDRLGPAADTPLSEGTEFLNTAGGPYMTLHIVLSSHKPCMHDKAWRVCNTLYIT